MDILPFFSMLIFGFFFYMGLNLYLMNNKNLPHKLFFYMLLALLLMALSTTFAYSASNKKNFILWYRISLTAILIYFPLSVHFCAALSKLVRFNLVWKALIYLPALFFIIKDWTSLFYMHKFTQTNNLWLMKPNSTNSSFHLLGVYFTATTLLSLFLLLTWQKRATTNKEKKQALILFSTLLITFLAATAETFLIPALTSYWSIGLAPLAIGIWISGILYCFIRFKFLSLTPEVIGFQLVNNIKETTILLDNNFTILYYNQACAKLLKQPLREEAKKPIQTIITEWQKIKPEIEEINANHSGSFSCRVHLINSKQETILIDARFSIIKDKFHDPLGIMIIAEEVKEALQLKQLYKITIRELDIIQLLMEGSSTKQIATQLTISERTVKTHLTSIYNKTEVENKIQLFNLLHRFNLFPEHTADKRLLIIPQKEAN